MKAQTHAVRQDLMRGIRWGAILVIALLLAVAAYRVLGPGPAVASEQPTQPQPAPTLVEEPAPAIVVSDPVQTVEPERPKAPPVFNGPDVPPPPAERAKARPVSSNQPKAFTPPPPERTVVATPRPASPAPVTIDAVPEAQAIAVSPAEAAPQPAPELAPAPGRDKQGRTGKIVRSVGRIFRFGRKETAEKEK